MTQTTLSVPLEVKPESCAYLSDLIEALRHREESPPYGQPEQYDRVAASVPALHFLSMSVFVGEAYDPLFVLEANFDGTPGPFWAQMEGAFGEDLRTMLRCCKRPLDRDAALYDAVTAPGARTPVVPYFERRTQRPSVFHHGNRGLTRDRILADGALFLAIRSELARANAGGPSPYRGAPAASVHGGVRAALLPAFAWLDEAPPVRIPAAERTADIARLLAFVVGALLVLSAPGLLLAAMIPVWRYAAILAIALMAVWIYARRHALPGAEVPTSFRLSLVFLRSAALILLLLAAYAMIATLVLTPIVALLQGTDLRAAAAIALRSIALGLLCVPLSLVLILLWLRYLEQRDSWHDAPRTDERLLREMLRREDWIAQNHMGSLVLIKPGVLRSILVHAGHLGLGLFLRVQATDGYLGSMRTVHFAHWAFVNNGSRLMFFSNFDHSWDSYLDDFIEKAHAGLTLAWGTGVGFPATRFLVLDGASHGRQFKAWALASRSVSRFWYSAYRDLTVDQIERNARIATGLRKPVLSEQEAAAWMLDL